MCLRGSICAIATAALLASIAPALAFDDALYPDLSGQWLRINLHKGGQITFDPTKAWGIGQEAPLTPEYQKVALEASIADQDNGGQGNWYSGARCLPPGMPATMNGYNSLEFVVLPETTYILVEHNVPIKRRIYTDGRDWPKEVEKTFQGYSIGRWLDEDGDGHFDTLEVETRYFKGPRSIDPTGIPTHVDNQSIVKERIHLDKADPKVLDDELTLFDHALTRPWTVHRQTTTAAQPGQIPDLARGELPEHHPAAQDRRRALFQGRRREASAHAQGSAAARSEIFRPGATLTEKHKHKHTNVAGGYDGSPASSMGAITARHGALPDLRQRPRVRRIDVPRPEGPMAPDRYRHAPL